MDEMPTGANELLASDAKVSKVGKCQQALFRFICMYHTLVSGVSFYSANI